jgi:hypothetical protein
MLVIFRFGTTLIRTARASKSLSALVVVLWQEPYYRTEYIILASAHDARRTRVGEAEEKDCFVFQQLVEQLDELLSRKEKRLATATKTSDPE